MTKLSAIATGAGGFVASSQTQTGSGSSGPPSGTHHPPGAGDRLLQRAHAGRGAGQDLEPHDEGHRRHRAVRRSPGCASTHSTTTRQQYLTIMTKATTIGDILSVQEELDSVQSQIEQLQGQLQLLTSQTAYSTMTITVNEANAPPKPAPVPESGVVQVLARQHQWIRRRGRGHHPLCRTRPLRTALPRLWSGWAVGPCGGVTSGTTCNDSAELGSGRSSPARLYAGSETDVSRQRDARHRHHADHAASVRRPR